MKNIFTTLLMFASVVAVAQSPQLMNYQAIVRNTQGQPLENTHVNFQFIIQDSIAGGTAVFTETDTATTNKFGLATVAIGSDSSLSNVNWGANNKYMQVGLDISGGNTFTDMGTTRLLSVPYALNAGNGHFNLAANGADIYNTNTGNVGIGTATPAERLEVGGNIRLSYGSSWSIYSPDAQPGASGYDITLQAGGTPWSGSAAHGGSVNITAGNVNSAGAGNDGGNVILTSGANPWIGQGVNGDIIFQVDAEPYYGTPARELMRISGTSGNVGIGTSTPAVLLDVEGGAISPAFKLVDGTQGAGNVLTSDANGNASWAAPVKVDFKQDLYGGSLTVPSGTLTAADYSSGYAEFNDNITYNAGIITVPNSGVYHFDFTAEIVNVFSNTAGIQIQVYINGAFFEQHFSEYVSEDYLLSAGDDVEFFILQGSGSSVSISPFAYEDAHLVR